MQFFFLNKINDLFKGLVNRAILLSGSALSPWAFINDPDAVREEVSNQMACHLDPMNNSFGSLNKTENIKPKRKFQPDDITKCLKNKPLEALMGIQLPSIR
jgi:Carboxylesterase family